MMEWKDLLSSHRLGCDQPETISQERSPFQRDFDRIVFSGAFRRLQNKTQIFPLLNADHMRTRLTHSLEVSSIGRSLGTAVGVKVCENYDTGAALPSDIGVIVATAALAHDIGNPPLGHAGEDAIQHWFRYSAVAEKFREKMSPKSVADIIGFDGNAQGFRVLSRLEMPDLVGGMQLTSATLGAFTKYPQTAAAEAPLYGVRGKKFSFFRSEKELFADVAEHCGLERVSADTWIRHPLSFLVEAADDIAYLVVDFEDGYRRGLVEYDTLKNIFLDLLQDESVEKHVAAMKSKLRAIEYLRARVIGKLVKLTAAAFLDNIDDILSGKMRKPLLEALDCAATMRQIRISSRDNIYNSRDNSEIIVAEFEMIMGMLDIFTPCVDELANEFEFGVPATAWARRLGSVIPDSAELKSRKFSVEERVHFVIDYISGMTDSYAVSLYQKLKGISL